MPSGPISLGDYCPFTGNGFSGFLHFINPLLSVLMGVLFFRECLRPWQWLPLGLATAGGLYLTFAYGAPPWIALTLAFSFGMYGIVKKTAAPGSFYGLTLETGILLLPATLYLLHAEITGQGAFLHTGNRSRTRSSLVMVWSGRHWFFSEWKAGSPIAGNPQRQRRIRS